MLAYGVDGDGDGRIDLTDAADALASTAAYLARSGWQRGELWGTEVRLPPGFDAALTGRDRRRATGDWAAMGVRTAEGGALPDHGPGTVVLPQGATGPAFLLWRN